MSENIPRILQPFNICIAHKPTTTLGQLQTNAKHKEEQREEQTGSGLSDQLLRLPRLLRRRDWQNPHDKTDWTQASDEERWCHQSHRWASSTYEPHFWPRLCVMSNLTGKLV